MNLFEQRPRDRRWRRYFRRCRIALWLAALALVGALTYLNQVGLPEFLRRPLLEKLRDRGLDLQLSTLRLHFYRGIVAQNVQAGQIGDEPGPRFTAREADLNLSWPALARLELVVSGVDLREGQLRFPVADPDRPGRELAVQKMRVALRFLPDDAWSLEDFHAVFAGVDFSLTGVITNATAVRPWPFLRGEKAARGGLVAQRVRLFADALEKIHFATGPEVRCMLSGDARNLESFTLRLTVTAPDADTPWGKLTNGVLSARLLPAAPVERPLAELQLHAASAQTPWVDLAHFQLDLGLRTSGEDTNLVNASLSLDAATALTRWASVTNAHFTAQWLQALTNAIPLSGHSELRADAASSRWASAKSLQITTALAPPPLPVLADGSWGGWQWLQPYAVGWSVRAARLETEQLGAAEVVCGGNWSAPLLQITNLHLRFPEGGLAARGRLEVASRVVGFELQSDFDVHRLSPWLPEAANRWLEKFTCAPPPHLAGSGAVTLPAWTNRAPDWRAEVLPSLRLAAQVAVTNGAYLGVPVDWVTTHLSYTNQVWRVPDLVAGRPEGQLRLAVVWPSPPSTPLAPFPAPERGEQAKLIMAGDQTQEFFLGVHSTVDVRVLRPLFGTDQRNGFDEFTLTQPPVIEGEVRGRWREPGSVGIQGRVGLTDFSFREQSASRFESALRYTNQCLEFLGPRLERGAQTAGAEGITVDFNVQRVYFTNALSTAEPLVIARAIGPKTGRTIEPYRFRAPPVVRVNGYAPLHGEQDADLRFDVDGGPFEWLQFKIPHIAGQLHWLGDSLRLTNVQLTAYDGAAAGFAHFDFRPARGTDFQFALGVTNADLRLLMGDVATETSNLEGRLSGELVITHASSEDKFSWDGYGQLHLKDGLIWAIPVFGVLSKPLDSLAPGLGSARLSEGAGQFTITHGVVFSDTLELRAPTTRLLCHGTVDFAGEVNARVAAVPVRDALGFGRILGLALWPVSKLFEYRVTGTFNAPKPEPVYLPKMLLHPFRTFEEIFSGEAGKTGAPPVFKDLPGAEP